MELREIKYFITIAEERNLSKAAKKLYISQPALSSFLSKMEIQSNVKFFNRLKNNSLELTEAGKIFLEGSKKILEMYNNIEQRVADLDNNVQQKITIGVTDERFFRIIARCIPFIKEIHPNVYVQVVIYPATDLIRMVVNGELDIAHSAYIEENCHPDLTYIPLTKVEVDLVVPSYHPLAVYSIKNMNKQKRINLNEIGDTPLVLLDPSTVLRKVEDKYFNEIQFTPNVMAQVNTSFSTLSIVETGLFLGLAPESFKSETISYIRLDPPLYYTSGLFYKKNTYLSKPMQDFIHIMKDASTLNLANVEEG